MEQPKKEEEEKVELDKWGDPIKKRKRKVRPLSLWAQRDKFEFTVHLPATLTVIEDRNARFICGVNSGGKVDIKWLKNDRKIRFEKLPRILDYTRNSTGCIGIECTQMSDAGIYRCEFTDVASGEVLTTQCELIVMPKIKKIKELSQKIPPTFVRKLQCELLYSNSNCRHFIMQLRCTSLKFKVHSINSRLYTLSLSLLFSLFFFPPFLFFSYWSPFVASEWLDGTRVIKQKNYL